MGEAPGEVGLSLGQHRAVAPAEVGQAIEPIVSGIGDRA